MGLQDSLVRRGYVPKEFVPAVKSTSFADSLGTLSGVISSPPLPASKCSYHSIPKVKLFRRLIAFPHPLHQAALAGILEEHWSELQTHMAASLISQSSLEEDPDQKSALKRKATFEDLPLERAARSCASRYLLRADLSRFYQTIYTHSISWALHSKAIAKSQKFNKKLAGNLIDMAVRNTQDQQTIGVPVGPETSDLIAELIGVSIDKELQEALPNLSGIRYVDDFNLYFSTRSAAENALVVMTAAVKEFELEINQFKTDIVELPESLEPFWKTELRSFSIRPESQHHDLFGFFSRAFDLTTKFPTSSVLKYAVTRSSGFKVSPDEWPSYESFLLNSLMGEPALFPVFAQIMLKYRDEGYPVNLERLEATLWEICQYHSNYQQGYEVAWSLWVAKLFYLKVPDTVHSRLSKMDDPLVSLLALDLRAQGLALALDTTQWDASMTGNELWSANWLLAYEAHIKGWLSSKLGDDYIGNDAFFSELRKQGVSFYDEAEGQPATFSIWEGYS